MKHHTLLNAIRLAESIPQDRDNFQVLRELLVELHTIAKTREAAA
jgi:hypothetical protein